MNSIEGVFGKLKNPYQKLAFGGVMLSVLIFLFPPLYGEGYDTIEIFRRTELLQRNGTRL